MRGEWHHSATIPLPAPKRKAPILVVGAFRFYSQ